MDNQHELASIILSKAATFLSFWKLLFAGAAAIFLESLPFIGIAYGMIALHVASGFLVSWRLKKPWDEEKWFKNGMKIVWFPIGIMATKWMEQTFDVGFSVTTLAAAYLAFHDFRGFWDNFGKLTGIDVWNAVFEQIDWKRFGRKGEK